MNSRSQRPPCRPADIPMKVEKERGEEEKVTDKSRKDESKIQDALMKIV